jgi:hypothetical protein
MQLKDYRLLVAFQLLVTSAGIAGAIFMLQQTDVILENRQVMAWDPKVEMPPSGISKNNYSTELDEALGRPLFRRDRRPFVIPSQTPVVTAQIEPAPPILAPLPTSIDSSQLILKGLALRKDNQQALIASSEKPDGEWYGLGYELGGWKIMKLDSNSVDLSGAGQTATLTLYVDNPSKPVGTP